MHALCLSLMLLTADAAAPARWPGFLGQGASPVAVDALPLNWSPDKNIAWTADIPGHGQSSPVVWGERVFVTSVTGDMKETLHVVALDLPTGKAQWKLEFPSTDPVKNSLYVSRAAPTPVVDGDAVYTFFESGDLQAISHDGKLRWQRSLANDYGKFKNKFGLAASPVQTQESIIVLIDDEGPSYLVALSKTDGRPLWKTDRKSRTSWSSPALVTVGETQQVVCSSAGSVDGYDPKTGQLLWSNNEVGGNTAATPFGFSPGKFLVGASAGREGDNAEAAKKSNFAMSVELVDGVPTPKVLWKSEQATTSFGSPIIHAGYAYYVNRSGVVYCLEADTGKLCYTQRTKQSVWATPLGLGDRVYLFGKEGHTTVLAAGAEYKVLAENQLWDPAAVAPPDAAKTPMEDTEEKRRSAAMFSGPVQYGIAAIGNNLLIRTGEKLYCVRK
ncbi:MAG TPA: PQQ-binding-like beta-propeller repeat protein [Pirellulaceae bacterium]|nr:PQQ-binding-like beta-propeller repeat protein [Pirellulaceae bacterium]